MTTGLKATLLSFLTTLGNMSGVIGADTAQNVMSFTTVDAQILTIVLQIICPIGFMLMVVYSMFGFLEEANKGKDIDIYDILQPLSWILVADIILTNMGKIISLILGASNLFSKHISDTLTSFQNSASPESLSSVVSNANDATILLLLVCIVFALLGFIIGIFANAVTLVVVFSAKVQMLMQIAFSPIGFAGFADASRKMNAIAYFKKICGTALYCGAIMLALYIASAESGSVSAALVESTKSVDGGADILSGIITWVVGSIGQALIPFAAIGAISSAKTAIDQAVGV